MDVMPEAAGASWGGWPSPTVTGQPWLDLTHPISPEVPRLKKFAPPRVEKISSIPEQPSSVTRIEMVCHTGTHLDAPNHFVPDAPGVDEIPLERLYGAATVIHARVPRGGEVGVAELEAAPIAPGEIVILDTGWWRQPGDGDHPYLSVDAARWLVHRAVTLLATDLPTPDLPVRRRDARFDWPVHRILLGNGVLIAENLANLGSLPPRVQASVMPLPIVGADGAPARVLVRPAEVE
jgi:arylformamidase